MMMMRGEGKEAALGGPVLGEDDAGVVPEMVVEGEVGKEEGWRGRGEGTVERPVGKDEIDVGVAVSRSLVEDGPRAVGDDKGVMATGRAVERAVEGGDRLARRALDAGGAVRRLAQLRKLRDGERFLDCVWERLPGLDARAHRPGHPCHLDRPAQPRRTRRAPRRTQHAAPLLCLLCSVMRRLDRRAGVAVDKVREERAT
mmetsp:Transcript_13476/g.42560  ORF Transcript_13476/g.42560 Transcript_13476/m.42560 type:complete len:200 (+) Transcript_13476:351-950(+)